MPPCADTVCERVGKTFDKRAHDLPDSVICSAARIPAPPAPITTASNSCTGRLIYTLHKTNKPMATYTNATRLILN